MKAFMKDFFFFAMIIFFLRWYCNPTKILCCQMAGKHPGLPDSFKYFAICQKRYGKIKANQCLKHSLLQIFKKSVETQYLG